VLGIADWTRDLLLSRGALADSEEGEAVRAFLPEEIARALGAQEWLSLRFGAGPGADDAGEWIERLGALLPAGPIVAAVRPRNPAPASAIDADAVLSRGLVIQNGIYRRLEDDAGVANYCVFTFEYAVESDDRSLGRKTRRRGLPRRPSSGCSPRRSVPHDAKSKSTL
jgi:hypothetical protein